MKEEENEIEESGLPDFEGACQMLADVESPDEWSYNVTNLQADSSVKIVAMIYERPSAQVARRVADLRREWVKNYLAEKE